jgi:hypothetical protein
MRLIPRWRKMTWVFMIVNALFLIWVIAGVSSRPSEDCATDPDVLAGTISKSTCEAASDVGTGIGVALIFVLWFFVFIVLSLIWFMTRPSGPSKSEKKAALAAAQEHASTYRECPHCKEQMRRDASMCPHCRTESQPWKLHEGRWWTQDEQGAWYYLDEAANEWKQLQVSSDQTPQPAIT